MAEPSEVLTSPEVLAWLKERLRGTNPRIPSATAMIKTTPPGRGSRLLDVDPADEVLSRYAATTAEGVRHLVTGEFDEADLGVSCYHAKTGGVELWLNHLVDGPGEYVVVDMTAGADAFASGLRRSATRCSGASRRRPGCARPSAAPSRRSACWSRRTSQCSGPFWQPSLDTRERDWAAYHSATVAFHLRKVLAFQNCHRVAAFAPAAVDSAVYREFVSPRGQVLNQAPELRDC